MVGGGGMGMYVYTIDEFRERPVLVYHISLMCVHKLKIQKNKNSISVTMRLDGRGGGGGCRLRG